MNRRRTLVVTILLGALLGGLFFFLVARGGAAVSRIFVGPVVRVFYVAGSALRTIPDFFQSRRELRMENEELRTTLQTLAFDYATLEALKKEYEELKKLLAYEERSETLAIVARITGFARDPFTQTVFIDRGEHDGVYKNAPVFARDGIFMGTIDESFDDSARVRLALDTRSKISARVVGREGALGILEGHGALYRLILIPRDVPIEENDLVVTDAVSPIPAGLVIGRVESVQSEADAPFKTIVVLPPLTVTELSFVAVLTTLAAP